MKPSIIYPKPERASGTTLIDDVRFGNSRQQGSRVFDNNNEINAGSFAELMETIAELAKAHSSGGGFASVEQASKKEASRQAHMEMVNAAFESQEALAALGNEMAETLQITANRDGFMRRFLFRQELKKGEFPRVRVDPKNVTASIATGPTTVDTQFIRDKTILSPEFYISNRPFVEQKDIDQTIGDILDETYTNSLTAFMVQEDRMWKKLADRHRGVENESINISGAFLPGHLSEMISRVNRWGIAPAFCLVAVNVWGDLVSGASTWGAVFDQVSKWEILTTGRIGTLNGVEMLSDHFRHEQHKVLEAGDIYIVGPPVSHGQYTDRGGIVSQPVDAVHERVPGRGWFMFETMSMAVINGRSIVHGRRSGKFPTLTNVAGQTLVNY